MKKEYVMEAVFTPDAYNALMRGAAVDNNGLRAAKGNYWPEQPYFRPKNGVQDIVKNAAARILIEAGNYVVFNIALPALKEVVEQNVVPFIGEKIDNLKNRKGSVTVDTEREESYQPEEGKIIYINPVRKGA